jgi:hypothetical protein
MARHKFDRKPPCAEWREGDGTDPRFELRYERGAAPNRKALQLCRQVERILAGVLAESSDDVLRELRVDSVVPGTDSGRLLVTVSGELPPDAALQALGKALSRLRHQVAAGIHRRKTPELIFRHRLT